MDTTEQENKKGKGFPTLPEWTAHVLLIGGLVAAIIYGLVVGGK